MGQYKAAPDYPGWGVGRGRAAGSVWRRAAGAAWINGGWGHPHPRRYRVNGGTALASVFLGPVLVVRRYLVRSDGVVSTEVRTPGRRRLKVLRLQHFVSHLPGGCSKGHSPVL